MSGERGREEKKESENQELKFNGVKISVRGGDGESKSIGQDNEIGGDSGMSNGNGDDGPC